jgi:hypothetical protein
VSYEAIGIGNETTVTLSLVIAYGERGERWESPRAVAAYRDRAPPKSRHPSHGTGSLGGPTDLDLMLLREVHEDISIHTVKLIFFLNFNCIVLSVNVFPAYC